MENLPLFEATWEDFNLLNSQFPAFHLEDKVNALGGVLISPKSGSHLASVKPCRQWVFGSCSSI